MNKKSYWVYILYCNNGSYYTGYTSNLPKRYQAHLNGKASKYTRSFKPHCIVQCWNIMGDKSLAMRIEHWIKKLPRSQKENLIAFPSLLSVSGFLLTLIDFNYYDTIFEL